MKMSIGKLLLLFILIALVFVFVVFKYDEITYCEKLVDKVEQEFRRNELVKWVDTNIDSELLNVMELQMGGVAPGEYKIPIKYNKNDKYLYDFEIFTVNGPGKNIFENTTSILFAERSRAGILIKLSDRKTFGNFINEDDLIKLSERVAVVCLGQYAR